MKEKGYKLKVGKFLFCVIGKVFVYGELDGFVKFVVDEEINDIFGVYMIGLYVIDMIFEVGFVRVFDVIFWEVVYIIYLYLLLFEVIGEVVFVVDGRALYV